MKIIDAHMHFSNIQALKQGAVDSGVDYSLAGLLAEYAKSGVTSCVCMGLSENIPSATPDKLAQTPMVADLSEQPDIMGVCLGINPHTLDDMAMQRVKDALTVRSGIAGFKIYAGYYHVDVNDDIYTPIYKLASERNLTVAIHGGETYFKGGLIEYSRPVHVDKLAYSFPQMNIVICHLGFPWVMEACEVATKNDNVYLDISGLVVGGANECKYMQEEPLLRDYYKQGLLFMGNYKKVLFGTDWPLVPIEPYIEFCKALVPQHAWEDVFYNNATRLYHG